MKTTERAPMEITLGTGQMTGGLVRDEDGKIGLLLREKQEGDPILPWGETYIPRNGDITLFFVHSEVVGKVIELLQFIEDRLETPRA